MNKKIRLLAIFSLFAFFVGFLLHTSVFAQKTNTPALNLTVTPATIDMTATPGSTVQQKIRVRNNTSSPVDLSVQTSKLSTDDKGEVVPVDSRDSFLSWISYSPSTFTARPNEWIDVTIQVKIPATAAFGYYYAIRITPNNSQAKNNTNGSTLIGQALVPLLLDVKQAGAVSKIQLVSFEPTSSVFEYLPATFAITFMNQGNIHIRPQGNIFIATSRNKDTAVLEFNQAEGAMLPGQKRTYTATWDDGFLVKEPVMEDGTIVKDPGGNPKTHLVIHWDKLTSFRIGKYTAHLLAVYNDGTRDVPLESTVTFWVFPWKMILGATAVLIVVILLVRFWLKWYVKGQIKKYKS